MYGIINLDFKTNMGQRVDPTFRRAAMKFYQLITNIKCTITFLMTATNLQKNWFLVTKGDFCNCIHEGRRHFRSLHNVSHTSPTSSQLQINFPLNIFAKAYFFSQVKKDAFKAVICAEILIKSFKKLQCHNYPGIVNFWKGELVLPKKALLIL